MPLRALTGWHGLWQRQPPLDIPRTRNPPASKPTNCLAQHGACQPGALSTSTGTPGHLRQVGALGDAKGIFPPYVIKPKTKRSINILELCRGLSYTWGPAAGRDSGNLASSQWLR